MSDTTMDDQLPDGDGRLGNGGETDSAESGGLAIVSDTDAYASTEPLGFEDQTPPATPADANVEGDDGGAEGPDDSGAGEGVPGEEDGGADGGAEGPADSGAGDTGIPGEDDGGADGGAEGPADSGAGDTGIPGEDDGGADGGADASR